MLTPCSSFVTNTIKRNLKKIDIAKRKRSYSTYISKKLVVLRELRIAYDPKYLINNIFEHIENIYKQTFLIPNSSR
jgi:hypothetical protein